MHSRDLTGYAGKPPHAAWPEDARVAVQFVLNVEEGAESSVLNGDSHSESYLHELPGRPPREGERDPSIESMYEYGSRAGVWRILDLFRQRQLPLTVFAVGQALELNPPLAAALADSPHEVAGHGYRWIDYHQVPEQLERAHIERTVSIIEDLCGERPTGWYTGRTSPNTRRLLGEVGGFLYDSDNYSDDLPFWLHEPSPHLVVPYTLVNNDFRYLLQHGFSHGEEFFELLKDAFDQLFEEGAHRPKMMSVGLHGRVSGHPARARSLARFLDYIGKQQQVWICRRDDIAKHWIATHPPNQ